MKRFALCVSLIFMAGTGIFAQADLQPLATVKLNKSETITLKQLKNRVEIYGKQNGISSFTVEQKKEILNAMIDEKLVVQAATKAGMVLTDSQVNQYFMQNVSQQFGRNVTEAEFEEIIKKQTGKSFEDYMKNTVGMGVAEYKSYLKNQLIAQQYVLQQKQEDHKGNPLGWERMVRNNKAFGLQIHLLMAQDGRGVKKHGPGRYKVPSKGCGCVQNLPELQAHICRLKCCNIMNYITKTYCKSFDNSL